MKKFKRGVKILLLVLQTVLLTMKLTGFYSLGWFTTLIPLIAYVVYRLIAVICITGGLYVLVKLEKADGATTNEAIERVQNNLKEKKL